VKFAVAGRVNIHSKESSSIEKSRIINMPVNTKELELAKRLGLLIASTNTSVKNPLIMGEEPFL
jgi:hypothetical protein